MTAPTKFITGAETRLAFVAETTPGTTPATPTTIQLPYVKWDAELMQDTYEDTSVFADRMEHDVIVGLRKVTGSLEFNLSHANFDPILQTAFWNTWATDTLKVGTSIQTVTFEEWHPDANTAFGRVFTGCLVDKLQIKMQAKGIVTCTASLVGFNMATETTQLNSSPTAPTVETPFTCVSATVTVGGTAIAYMTAFDVSLDNKSAAIDAIGSVNPLGYVPGLAKVTGTASFYIPDTTLISDFLNVTGAAISVTLEDAASNTMLVEVPNITFTSVKMPSQGQGVTIGQFAFTAVKDAGTATNLLLTHS